MPPPDKVPSLAQLAVLGAQEAFVTVSLYDPPAGARGPEDHMRPVRWQGIVKHQNSSLPWAVAVRDDPDEAERDSRLLFVSLHDKPHRRAALHKKPPPVRSDDFDGAELI